MRTLDDIGRELDALSTAEDNPELARTCLALGEEVLEHWVTARGAEPTHEQREGFRLLALHHTNGFQPVTGFPHEFQIVP